MSAYDHGEQGAIAARRPTRQVKVGWVPVGGGAPVGGCAGRSRSCARLLTR